MFRWVRRIAILIGAVSALAASAASGQVAEQVVHKTFPSVVLLVLRNASGSPVSLGSGFFVRDGVVATNLHVVKGAAGGYAKPVGQRAKYDIAGVLGVDKARDLVLLAVRGTRAPPLVVADSNHVMVGQEVYVIGNPRGLEGTVSEGIISGVRRLGAETLLQITAPISPGSSGGPVLDADGRVIGVAAATVAGGQNLNFAVPSSYLTSLLGKMKPLEPLATLVGTQPPQRKRHPPLPNKTFPQTGYALEHPHEVACARGAEDGRSYAEVEQECQEALSSESPDHLSMIHFAYGDLLLSEKKWEGAIAEFKASLRLSESDDYGCHQKIGEALEGKGDLDAAIGEYRLALTLAQSQVRDEVRSGMPKDIADIEFASLHYDLGSALFQENDMDGAVAEFQEAVRLRPGDPQGYDILATVLEMKGEQAAAEEQCRTARELTLSSRPISDLCRRILDKSKQ